jgi:hypothetical protein
MELMITIWYQVPEWRPLRLKDYGEGKCIDQSSYAPISKTRWENCLGVYCVCIWVCAGACLLKSALA